MGEPFESRALIQLCSPPLAIVEWTVPIEWSFAVGEALLAARGAGPPGDLYRKIRPE